MNRIYRALWLSLAGLSIIWLISFQNWPATFTYFSFRKVFIQYSGIIAIGTMSLCMILATRPAWLMKPLNGLDKSYRLHKWLGITALISSATHWWFAKGTKWMISWGWLSRPARKGAKNTQNLEGIEALFRSWRSFAEDVGEWVFYGSAILLLIALIQYFPYHWFIRLHKWLAVGYIALAFHSLILLQFNNWASPIGWLMAVLLVYGILSSILILFNQVGKNRKLNTSIQQITHHQKSNTYELTIEAKNWAGHQAGQFIFLKKQHSKEQPHPFTIASHWQPNQPQLRLLIKALGDYTNRLGEQIHAGDEVTIEGPYGAFHFQGQCDRQIWIAGGIGITPFLARLSELAQCPNAQKTTLFYCYQQSECVEAIKALSESAGIAVHFWPSEKGRLTAQTIQSLMADWSSSDIWFCGPQAFGVQLKNHFCKQGLPSAQFHQEWFAMR